MTFFIKTFGCQMNVADSERLESYYLARGYKKAASIEKADHIIINTCCVRQSAEDRVYALVKKLKSNNKKVILTGCVVGMALKDKSGKLLERLKKAAPNIDEFLPIEEVGFDIPPIHHDKTHAYIPISNGCNNFCTYCVVPYSRGREVSRPFNEIINEIKNLIKKGTEEITLVGQNVNSYGADIVESMPHIKPVYVKHLGRQRIPTLFPYLLEQVSKIKNLKKISFISSNPWDFSDELIEVIAKNKKINRNIHLPVQSGDNKILKKMNRWYTAKEYLNLVKKIKSKIPKVKLSTDIIVGFPEESEKAFQNTINLCKKVGFIKAYIAEYSPRPGTAAYKNFPDNIPNTIKKQRFRILDKLINKKLLSGSEVPSEVEGRRSRAKPREKIVIISGPTATGKTKLALQLAHEFNGELISADSRQIYKGMNIGTGKDVEKGFWDKKNQAWVINSIPIYMLDQISPNSYFNVAQYKSGAGEAIEKILSAGRLPIIVGGTGFYIKSLLAPPATLGIPQNFALRHRLNSKTREKLQEILKKLDPQKFNSMNYSDQNNPPRLIRAIEVTKFHSIIPPQKKQNFDRVAHISLTAPLPYIYKLTDQRIDAMIKNGLLEEIKNLLKKYSWKDPGLKTLGYIEFKEYFENKKALVECLQRLKYNHHSLIRRQLTWFKKEKNIHRIDISKDKVFEKSKRLLRRYLLK